MNKLEKQEKIDNRNEAIKFLKTHLKPGSKVYTMIRSVSSSGMSRQISVLIADKKKGEIINIDWWVARVIDVKRSDKNGSLIIGGCGMDMGFHVVYTLSRYLFPKGFKLPKGAYGRNGDTSGKDRDGGYALKQIWL